MPTKLTATGVVFLALGESDGSRRPNAWLGRTDGKAVYVHRINFDDAVPEVYDPETPRHEIWLRRLILFPSPVDIDVVEAHNEEPGAGGRSAFRLKLSTLLLRTRALWLDFVSMAPHRAGAAAALGGRRVQPGMRWGDGKVWVDSHLRCLLGESDLRDTRSNAWLIPLSAEVAVSGPKDAAHQRDTILRRLEIGKQRQVDDTPVATLLRYGAWGMKSIDGPLGGAMRHLGLGGTGWAPDEIEVRFSKVFGQPTSTQPLYAPRFEVRARRSGAPLRLPHVPIEARTDDWIKVVQRACWFDGERNVWSTEDTEGGIQRSDAAWVLELSYSERRNPGARLIPNPENQRVLDAWNVMVHEPQARALEEVRAASTLSVLPRFDAASDDLIDYSTTPRWLQVCVARDENISLPPARGSTRTEGSAPSFARK